MDATMTKCGVEIIARRCHAKVQVRLKLGPDEMLEEFGDHIRRLRIREGIS
jgi:hypothetical protein